MQNLMRPNEVPSPRSYWSRLLQVRECKDFLEIQKKLLQARRIGLQNMAMLRPHFMGLGAQKAGTTWLHEHLRKHPDIFIPPDKEAIHYFNRNFHLPLSWYLSFFSGKDDKIRGEITADYGIIPRKRIKLIHSLWPDMKLILLLRDPIARAWSHARMSFRDQQKRSLTSITTDEWIAHFNGLYSRTKGNYLNILDNWLSFYPEQQLKLVYNEDLAQNPAETLASIYRFLEIDDHVHEHSIGLNLKINTGQHIDIPSTCLSHLKQMYAEMIEELSKRYGGNASNWHKKYYG